MSEEEAFEYVVDVLASVVLPGPRSAKGAEDARRMVRYLMLEAPNRKTFEAARFRNKGAVGKVATWSERVAEALLGSAGSAGVYGEHPQKEDGRP